MDDNRLHVAHATQLQVGPLGWAARVGRSVEGKLKSYGYQHGYYELSPCTTRFHAPRRVPAPFQEIQELWGCRGESRGGDPAHHSADPFFIRAGIRLMAVQPS